MTPSPDGLRTLRPWAAPELTGLGRLPAHGVRRSERLLLDGTWRFQLLPAPEDEPGPRWATAVVPGAWTMQTTEDLHGVTDLPWYTNVQMPFPQQPPEPPAANPTGVYEREVEIPSQWAGRRIVLHVGAAESVLLVRVGGRDIGIGKDSHLPSEFDVTRAVTPGRVTTVRLTVVKWSDASFVEDQDQWWHGGLTRSVSLYATAPTHLADVRVVAGLASGPSPVPGDGAATGTLRVDVRIGTTDAALPAGWSVTGRLTSASGTPPLDVPVPVDDGYAADLAAHDRVSDWLGQARLALVAPGVNPWSAHAPARYLLTVRLHDRDGAVLDEHRSWTGFRTVAVRGTELLINGVPELIRGVNRHDVDPLTGRSPTADQMRADLVTMKRFGFNAVRTSHYPNDPALLDLADELGLYVIDEADIEAHDHAHEIADDPRYLPAFVERVARMVRRDGNHPSVIAWSLGNESDYGANHDAAAGWVRRHDPDRPLHYEGAIKDDWTAGRWASDLVCPMYPPLADIVAYARSPRADRPLIMCEYSHAMGNSNGTLAEHWAAIEATPGLQGGFIWEFRDHGLLQRLDDGRPAGELPAGVVETRFAAGITAPGYRWAYGGDFGDTPHDGAFCADGLTLPDRTPKPALYEHRELAAPVGLAVIPAPGHDMPARAVRLTNRRQAGGLGDLAAAWCLSVPGREDTAVPCRLPDLAPGESRVVDLPPELPAAATAAPTGAEVRLTLRVTTAHDTAWAPAGTDVCLPSVQLRRESRPLLARTGAAPGGVPLTLDGDGLLVHPALSAGPRLSLWRAPTDNDRVGGVADRWRALGLADDARRLVSVHRQGDTVTVLAEVVTAVGVVRHRQELRSLVRPDGVLVVLVSESAVLPTGLDDVPRVGSVFETAPGPQVMEWFGQGPWETYPDRRHGGPVGHHRRSVDEAFTPYLRPQESGGRAGVRHLRLLDGERTVLALDLDEPRQLSVTRYRAGDLDAARHHDELVPRPGCVVHLDAAHRGLGTASCGPDTLPGYLVGAGTHTWSWALRLPS